MSWMDAPEDTQKTFIFFPKDKSAAVELVCTRTSIDAMARYNAGGGGDMIDADEQVWIDLDAVGGYAPIDVGTIAVEPEANVNFTVVTVRRDRNMLILMLKRSGFGTKSVMPATSPT